MKKYLHTVFRETGKMEAYAVRQMAKLGFIPNKNAVAMVIVAAFFVSISSLPSPAAAAANFKVTNVIPGVTANPVLVTFPPGISTVKYVVATLKGVFLGMTSANKQYTFMDASGLPLYNADNGFYGLAFHPQFATNYRFFATYKSKGLNWTLAEFKATKKSDGLVYGNPTPVKILLSLPSTTFANEGGFIQFAPDGTLYISTGDGPNSYGTLGYAKDSYSLFGAILRISVDCPAGTTTPYCIPASNPYSLRAAGHPAVWSKGVRNPWRFWIDSLTTPAQVYIADVGEDQFEEINIEPFNKIRYTDKGDPSTLFYGWNISQGSDCVHRPGQPAPSCDTSRQSLPKYTWPTRGTTGATAGWCCAIGGVVARNPAQSKLYGRYFYGDLCGGKVCSLKYDSKTGKVSDNVCASMPIGPMTGFGLDSAGNVYAVTLMDVFSVTPV